MPSLPWGPIAPVSDQIRSVAQLCPTLCDPMNTTPQLLSQTPLQHAFGMEGLYVPILLIHLLPKFKTYLTCASFSQLSAKSDLITCHVMVFNGFVIYFLSRTN